MRALVVYESMYGNTRTVASHIANGLRPVFDVDVVSVGEVTAEMLSAADVLVCGGPTHAHGMSRTSTRQAAVAAVTKKASDLALDPAATGPGLRDWLEDLGDQASTPAAAFDTRIDAPSALTGRASKGIARRLRQHGFHLLVGPESFLVDKANHLCDGELARAERWGASLAALVIAARPGRSGSGPLVVVCSDTEHVVDDLRKLTPTVGEGCSPRGRPARWPRPSQAGPQPND